MRLENKVALITGGASGMGASMARIFAKEGAAVVIADMLDGEGQKLAAEIGQANGTAMFQHLDVSSESEWQAAIAATLAAYGKLDILVNDAGISGSAVDDLFETAAWERIMSVNSTGTFLGMKFAIPEMQKAGGGSIVNISSISGVTGQRGIHVAYNASKGAIRTLSKAAAVQHGRDNIRVNSVHPGLMPPMRTSGRTADPVVRAKMLAGVPLRRDGRVEEVANAALFLASDEASYITGVELYVDGGFLAV
ncbi:MAG: glucose 1-dehydrogenase [Alphaproteobacteria bacterium]|nr:glucose 1-dehydrogenase [Alphaproteobacteria bacterium]